MSDDIFIIVVSPNTDPWGEQTLLTYGNHVAFSDCNYWTNIENGYLDNLRFVLLDQLLDDDKRNGYLFSLLDRARESNRKVILCWHRKIPQAVKKKLNNYMDVMAHNPVPFHHDGNHLEIKRLMITISDSPPQKRFSVAKLADCCNKFDNLVCKYLGKSDQEQFTATTDSNESSTTCVSIERFLDDTWHKILNMLREDSTLNSCQERDKIICLLSQMDEQLKLVGRVDCANIFIELISALRNKFITNKHQGEALKLFKSYSREISNEIRSPHR